MNKALKIMAILLVVMAALSVVLASPSETPDLSGTWVSEKNSEITLVIEQANPQIKITQTQVKKGRSSSRERIYFADARGETNPSDDGKMQLKSVTEWSGRKLIVKFRFVHSKAAITNERVDEYTVSRDGKSLTLNRSFTTSPVPGDASNNPYSAPRSQNTSVLSAPLRHEEKRKFIKVL